MTLRKANSLLQKRSAKTVFVVGAGFSAGLGYPLVNDLLIRLWPKIPEGEIRNLSKVITFHHPGFDPTRKTSFPNIETLLSEMAANEQLFRASRSAPTGFTREKLREIRDNLLYAISKWFHELFHEVETTNRSWLSHFKEAVLKTNATIISFNWDLVIDHLLLGDRISRDSYGLGETTRSGPILIKPHGSLNWYDGKQGENIKQVRRIELHAGKRDTVYAFTEFREPHSKLDRRYSPLIIPPVFNKSFEQEIFTPLWQKCVSEISVANNVVFLGYSLPDADLQARFILRCGFHNQVEGLPVRGGRAKPTGPSSVVIVNPDVASARRIEGIIARGGQCVWQPFTVEKWFEDRAGERSR
jgi:hypothetical protein